MALTALPRRIRQVGNRHEAGRLVKRRIVPVEDLDEMLQRNRGPPCAETGHTAGESDHADEVVQALRYRRLLSLGGQSFCGLALTPQAAHSGAGDQRAGPPPRLPGDRKSVV